VLREGYQSSKKVVYILRGEKKREKTRRCPLSRAVRMADQTEDLESGGGEKEAGGRAAYYTDTG